MVTMLISEPLMYGVRVLVTSMSDGVVQWPRRCWRWLLADRLESLTGGISRFFLVTRTYVFFADRDDVAVERL